MAGGLEEIVRLADPVGETIARWRRPNGLDISQVRIPLGVVGIIYESRPNVTADAAGLCLKSGNAAILKGGSEALRTNAAIARILAEAVAAAGLPAAAVQLIPLNFVAVDAGYSALGEVYDYIPEIVFTCLIGDITWANAHRAEVVRFIKSLMEATRWVYDPANDALLLDLTRESDDTSLGAELLEGIDMGDTAATVAQSCRIAITRGAKRKASPLTRAEVGMRSLPCIGVPTSIVCRQGAPEPVSRRLLSVRR